MKPLIFIILIFNLSCNNANKIDPIISNNSSYFKAIENNDIKLKVPTQEEWLYTHKETLQTFEAYKLQNPKKINDTQNIIYLKPIGQFTTLQKKALALTRQYLSIFFQTETMMLPSISDTFIPKKSKRLREKNNMQLLAPYILDTLLIKEIPKDAIAFMGITAKDLYQL